MAGPLCSIPPAPPPGGKPRTRLHRAAKTGKYRGARSSSASSPVIPWGGPVRSHFCRGKRTKNRAGRDTPCPVKLSYLRWNGSAPISAAEIPKTAHHKRAGQGLPGIYFSRHWIAQHGGLLSGPGTAPVLKLRVYYPLLDLSIPFLKFFQKRCVLLSGGQVLPHGEPAQQRPDPLVRVLL